MKRQKIIHLNSKEVLYTIKNLPVSFATSGNTTWTLTTPKGTYSFSGDATDENLKFEFPSFEGTASFSISYENLAFEESVTGMTLTLTVNERVVTGTTSVSMDNLTLNEVLALKIDIVGEEVHPMILEYTTTADNQTIKLPLSIDATIPLNAQVDWGDGSPVETITSNYPTHAYSVAGVYDVKISGNVPRINNNNLNYIERSYLTGIKSWGKLDGLTSMDYAFYDSKNLKGELLEDDYGCFENVTGFSGCFQSCSGLTGSIPENLFANCPNVEYFTNCFYRCSGLTGSIPENLFSNCPNVTGFSFCFSNCTWLTKILENLFSNCPNATRFYYCFNSCSGLTEIPENLFSNCPNVTNFGSCFYNCSGLTGTTPVDVLEDGTRVELWERAGKTGYPSSIDGTDCFGVCTGLSNYLEIPSEWK
jgi:hypothetical protein